MYIRTILLQTVKKYTNAFVPGPIYSYLSFFDFPDKQSIETRITLLWSEVYHCWKNHFSYSISWRSGKRSPDKTTLKFTFLATVVNHLYFGTFSFSCQRLPIQLPKFFDEFFCRKCLEALVGLRMFLKILARIFCIFRNFLRYVEDFSF